MPPLARSPFPTPLASLFPQARATGNAVNLTPYQGVNHSITGMIQSVHGGRGATHPLVRFVAEQIVLRIAPKDYFSEVLAVRYWVNAHLPYLRDPRNVEWIRDPVALIEEMSRNAVAMGAKAPRDDREMAYLVATDPRAIARADCDEVACACASLWLALGNRAEFITCGFQPPEPHTHVFARCEVPKASGKYVVLDPVAGPAEAFMLKHIRSWKAYPLD